MLLHNKNNLIIIFKMGLLTDDDIFNMILQESNNIYLYERREICAIDKLIKELKEECDYLDNLLENIKDVKINKIPRSKNKPSDHTPIEIEII